MSEHFGTLPGRRHGQLPLINMPSVSRWRIEATWPMACKLTKGMKLQRSTKRTIQKSASSCFKLWHQHYIVHSEIPAANLRLTIWFCYFNFTCHVSLPSLMLQSSESSLPPANWLSPARIAPQEHCKSRRHWQHVCATRHPAASDLPQPDFSDLFSSYIAFCWAYSWPRIAPDTTNYLAAGKC